MKHSSLPQTTSHCWVHLETRSYLIFLMQGSASSKKKTAYNLKIQHNPDKWNQRADVFSRYPVYLEKQDEQLILHFYRKQKQALLTTPNNGNKIFKSMKSCVLMPSIKIPTPNIIKGLLNWIS